MAKHGSIMRAEGGGIVLSQIWEITIGRGRGILCHIQEQKEEWKKLMRSAKRGRAHTEAAWQMLLYLNMNVASSDTRQVLYPKDVHWKADFLSQTQCKYSATAEYKTWENYKPHQWKTLPVIKSRGTEQEVTERLVEFGSSIIHRQPMRGWPSWPLCSNRRHSSLSPVLHQRNVRESSRDKHD